MNFKKASLFLLVFILLAGYVYVVEFKQHGEKEAQKAAAQQVLKTATDSIRAIQIKNTYGQFEIKKIQNEWRITQPLYTESDESVVNAMLSGLASAKKENELDILPGELVNFGLAESAMSILLTDELNSAIAIRMGDKTPVGGNVFVSVSDSSVFTLAESVKNNFNKNLFELRNKKMLQFKQNDAQMLKLKNNHGRFSFRKAGENEWRALEIDRPANGGKISSLLSKLANTNVKSFVDETDAGLKKFALENPEFEVELQLGPQQGGKNIRFSKKLNDKYYGFDESRKPIFEVDEAVIKDLGQKLSDFRDTDFAKFERNEVAAIELNYADTTLTLRRDSADVWLSAHGGEKIRSGKISAFFSALDYTTIAEFVKDGDIRAGRYGLDKPRLRLKLSDRAGLELFSAELGRGNGENIYAKTGEFDSVYLIPKSKLADLKLKLDDIKEESPENTGGE